MPSILIVEDDFLLADDLRRVLIERGHQVAGTAPDFDEAVRLADTENPDLALVDYKLRGSKDGIAVARELRERGIKIIYLTANHNDVKMLDGTTEVVPKPFDSAELLMAIERVVAPAERHV